MGDLRIKFYLYSSLVAIYLAGLILLTKYQIENSIIKDKTKMKTIIIWIFIIISWILLYMFATGAKKAYQLISNLRYLMGQ